jgi:hypothetical protein
MLFCRAGRVFFTKQRVRCLTDYAKLASDCGIPLEEHGAFVMDFMKKELELVKKDLALESLKFRIADRERFRFEAELAMKARTYKAITNVRPLLVEGAFTCSPAKTATDACHHLVNCIIKDGVLCTPASQDLLRLERNPQLQKDVENELKAELSKPAHFDVFHELARSHFLPKSVSRGIKGIVCGGELPLRAACALLFLELQRQGAVYYEIIYADEKYAKLCLLSDGKVIFPNQE